jgi:phosphopantothenoylcysteine decarboxylase/phosphopantothenate--cysteine ligase
MLRDKRILLIIGGGIAAYKCLDLIRRLRDEGATVRCILTEGGAKFVTPLALSSLSEDKVYSDLFSLTDEQEMGHIRLSREADLLLVAPCTADLMAKMAAGLAGDLATTALLATDKPVMIAPSMNSRMWNHPATKRNLAKLQGDGIRVILPGSGDLACGEVGAGRLAEVPEIIASLKEFFGGSATLPLTTLPLKGKKAIVTAGPTFEAIDPVRYIANRSSGKQGYAIAEALAGLGAEVVLVSGPTDLAPPKGVKILAVESALQMLAACRAELPADIAVCVAAVSDWRVAEAGGQKMKKHGGQPPKLTLIENPDILASLSAPGRHRPRLVVGFAAETENVIANAQAKLKKKGCDWVVANDVSSATGVMGGDNNTVHIIRAKDREDWPPASKTQVAERLARKISDYFEMEKT